MKGKQLPYWVRNIQLILIFILSIKIMGYFCIVEDRTVNQIYKVITRLGMTFTIGWVYFALQAIGCKPLFKISNISGGILYLGYLLLGIASFGWSTDVKYSMLQWSMTFESLVFVYLYLKVIVLVSYYLPKQKVDLIYTFTWATFPVMVIFIAGSFIEPDLFYRAMRGGEELRLGGYYMNPNELGMLSSIGASMSFLLFQQAKIKWPPLVVMISSLVVLVLTSSRSSAIGFFVIMGLLILQSNNKKLKITMVIAMLIGVPVLLQVVVFKSAGGVDEVLSMTGRLPFWKALLKEGIIREPFLGFGFMRINYTDYFESLNTYAAKMTHNTFMQVLMNLGFVGFYLVFWQMFMTLRSFFKTTNRVLEKHFFVALLIPIFINSLTEFGIFGETNYGILFYQFLVLLFVFQIRNNHSKKEDYEVRLFAKRWNPSV